MALPQAQREAFLMHYVEEIPYDDLAERLGASVSALKMRVLRAREALMTALGSDEVTPGDVRSSFYERRATRTVNMGADR